MILILDTSSILSMLLTKKGNNTRSIIQLAEKNAIVLASSIETLTELKKKASSTKIKTHPNYNSRTIGNFINFYQHCIKKFVLKDLKTPHIRDERDSIFLLLALISKADYLISGDKDLLEIKKVGKTHILKPADFLKEYKNRS